MRFCFLPMFLALGGAVTQNQEWDEQWQSFKIKYGKVYEEPVEDKFRKLIFIENSYRIAKHHDKYIKGLSSYDMAMNHFGDLLHHEFLAMTDCWLSSEEDEQQNGTTYLAPENVEIPRSVNWVTKGYVTEVKSQGNCGACWSFSATGALEGQHKKKTGNLVSLSEQNLIDCSAQYGNHGCHGGLPNRAFKYIMDNDGVDTELTYPYEQREGPCRFDPGHVGAIDSGFADVEKGSELELMKAVATVGPLSAGVDGTLETFKFYSEGVYDDPECSNKQLTHAIVVVGYGRMKGEQFWLVKNSWSEAWGEKGFGRIARNNNNQCGIATAASFPLV